MSDELRLAMDACRPDERDLSLPEMRAFAEQLDRDPALVAEFARAKKEDGLIRAALDDVPVPVGLADRLLATLAKPEPTPAAPLQAIKAKTSWMSRRLSLTLGVGIAAAALLAVFASQYAGQQPAGSVKTLEKESAAALAEVGTANDWSTDFSQPRERFPWNRWLLVSPQRWRATKVAGDSGVIYDLLGTDEAGAILVVVSTSRSYELPAHPDLRAGAMSGNQSLVSWKEPGLVYVLATDGAMNRPNRFLKPQKFAIADLGPQFLARR